MAVGPVGVPELPVIAGEFYANEPLLAGSNWSQIWPYPHASMFKPNNAQSAFSALGVCRERPLLVTTPDHPSDYHMHS